MKFKVPANINIRNSENTKSEKLAGNKMAYATILAKSSKGYNSAIYEPISMKFETQVLTGKYCMNNLKQEMLARNKMAPGQAYYPQNRTGFHSPKTANNNFKKWQSLLKEVVIGF